MCGAAVETTCLQQWLWLACLVLAVQQARAQFNDPRTYTNTPIGINQLELGYTYVHSNASLDTSLVVTGAKLNLNQAIIDYTRYFGLLHRLMWVEGSIPIAGLGGSVSGTKIHGYTSGAGDSSYQLAILLKGGPAFTPAQFKDYRPTTTLGASLTVTAPTGLYQPSKVLNLGSNRWSFKPEIALAYPFGPEQKWEFDAYANAYFYTDNVSYKGREILSQQPLPGVEAHISYSFNDSLWASVDTRYSLSGTTFVNGASQNNPQRNFIFGAEMNVSLNPRNSLVFEFAKAPVHHNGPALVGFSVKYDYIWGKGYR